MTANPPTAAAPHTPPRGAYVLALRRNVLTLAAVAVVTGSALHAAALAPLAPRAAMHAVGDESARAFEPKPARPSVTAAPAAAARDDEDDHDDEDEQEADGGPPAEPILEQIPVAPASEPQSLAVSARTSGASAPVAGGRLRGQLHPLPGVRVVARKLST